MRPVRSRRELGRFIRLPWRLYRDEPRWVPPLIFERKRFLDRNRNPFFERGEAEFFLAWRGDEPVGRVSAHIDRHFNAFHENRWGMFGFFECADDAPAAQALLEAAQGWLVERGRDRMVGPMDFTINDECGILVEGHERPPLIRQPWQHAYYPKLVEGSGLRKVMDLLMWELHISDRSKILPAIFELSERLTPEHGIVVRHMRKRDLKQEIRRFAEVYNAAWRENWGFVPLTDSDLEHAARESRPILDENWLLVAEKDGEPVGAALSFPDFNQVLAKLNGRLLPLGWLRALRARRAIDRIRVGFLGVKPEYQHTGVAAAFYVEHFEMASRTPQKWGEMGWILETNTAMNRGMEAMGGRIVKRYRLYEKALPRSDRSTAADARAHRGEE